MGRIPKYTLNTDCPREECFANSRGRCNALAETFEDCGKCPFFKTVERLYDDREKARQRIIAVGGEELWEKYHGNERRNNRERMKRAKGEGE